MKGKTGIGTWIGFLLILVWCLLPVAWIISLSLKPVAETTTGSPQFLPKDATLQNYVDLWDWPFIGADPTQVEQAFQNALINSFGNDASSSVTVHGVRRDEVAARTRATSAVLTNPPEFPKLLRTYDVTAATQSSALP